MPVNDLRFLLSRLCPAGASLRRAPETEHPHPLERAVQGRLVQVPPDQGLAAIGGHLEALERGSHLFIEPVCNADS